MIGMAYALDIIDRSEADKLADELVDMAKAESEILDRKMDFAKNFRKRVRFTK